MDHTKLFHQLEKQLWKKYKIFNSEDAYIEVTEDYLRVYRYAANNWVENKYTDWIVAFCRKFLAGKFSGYVYVFGYHVKI